MKHVADIKYIEAVLTVTSEGNRTGVEEAKTTLSGLLLIETNDPTISVIRVPISAEPMVKKADFARFSNGTTHYVELRLS